MAVDSQVDGVHLLGKAEGYVIFFFSIERRVTMGGLYNFLVLVGGTYMAYYLVAVVAKKVVPGKVAGWKLPGIIALIVQVLLAGAVFPLLGQKFLVNFDKTYNVLKEIGTNEYLFRLLEADDLVWSILTVLAVFAVVKVITEALEDRPESLPGTLIAMVIIFIALSSSWVIWDFLGLKIWIKSIELFNSIWFETEPGRIIREAVFPEMEVYP